MVFHVDSRLLQLKPNAFAIPAGRKLAAFDAGNVMLSRVLWVSWLSTPSTGRSTVRLLRGPAIVCAVE